MYGTSGGALTGCLLFLDIDLDALAEYVFICAAKARSSWRGAFLLRDYCRGAITQFCTKDAHKILQGRFEISITRLFPWYKNLRVNQFPSYEFLVQSLLCSACITPLAGLPMWLPGHGLCFDGGVSDLQLLKGLARNGTFCKLHCRKTNPKNLVVVCPFYSSRADIRPSKYVPMWWAFFPPEPYKLKELFELGQKDAHTWADKQDETSPSGSPRSSAESDTSEDDEWEWRRREKAAAAAAKDGAAAGAAAWRSSGPETDSRWWRYGARQTQPSRRRSSRRSSEDSARSPTRASVTRDGETETPSGSGSGSGSGSRRSLDFGSGSGASPGSGGFPVWAAECQEWASLSAEAARRRAVSAARAARAAAREADKFVHHEAEVAFEYASKGFCEAATAAEAMRRAASRSAAAVARKASDASDALAETVAGGGGGGRGTFQPHRMILKWVACLVVYFELVCQATFYGAGAFAAVALPGTSASKLWARSREFVKPAPRVLMQPVPGVRKGAKIDGATARLLGNISVTYRVLCYLVHMELCV